LDQIHKDLTIIKKHLLMSNTRSVAANKKYTYETAREHSKFINTRMIEKDSRPHPRTEPVLLIGNNVRRTRPKSMRSKHSKRRSSKTSTKTRIRTSKTSTKTRSRTQSKPHTQSKSHTSKSHKSKSRK